MFIELAQKRTFLSHIETNPKVSTTDNGIEVHEHMWSNEVFTAYVDEVAGEGCWRNQMQPRMEQIVTWSLLCAQVGSQTLRDDIIFTKRITSLQQACRETLL